MTKEHLDVRKYPHIQIGSRVTTKIGIIVFFIIYPVFAFQSFLSGESIMSLIFSVVPFAFISYGLGYLLYWVYNTFFPELQKVELKKTGKLSIREISYLRETGKSKSDIEDDIKDYVHEVSGKVYLGGSIGTFFSFGGYLRPSFDFKVGSWQFEYKDVVDDYLQTAKTIKVGERVKIDFSPKTMIVWKISKL